MNPNDRYVAIRSLIDQGLNYREIGDIIGVSRQTAREICIRLGLRGRDRKVMTLDKIDVGKKLRAQGNTWKEIASRLNVSATAVHKYCSSQHGPKERLETAVSLWSDGRTPVEIASRLCVSQATVYRYLSVAGITTRLPAMTPEKIERGIALRREGTCWYEIGNRLNVPAATVYAALRGLCRDIPRPKRKRRI